MDIAARRADFDRGAPGAITQRPHKHVIAPRGSLVFGELRRRRLQIRAQTVMILVVDEFGIGEPDGSVFRCRGGGIVLLLSIVRDPLDGRYKIGAHAAIQLAGHLAIRHVGQPHREGALRCLHRKLHVRRIVRKPHDDAVGHNLRSRQTHLAAVVEETRRVCSNLPASPTDRVLGFKPPRLDGPHFGAPHAHGAIPFGGLLIGNAEKNADADPALCQRTRHATRQR